MAKWKKQYCEELKEHMASGLSFSSFGGKIGVSRVTLDNWKKKYPEFKKAYEDGQLRCLYFWEIMGRSGAAGKIQNFNVTSWIFNMKNRFGWRDKKPDEEQVNVTVNLSDKVAKARERVAKAKK
jgi:hypothetical protein